MKSKKKSGKKIVIVGASGFGREVLWTLNDCNKKSKKYEILGFLDDNKLLHGKIIDKKPILGGLEWFSKNNSKNVKCVVAIGDCKIREKIVKKLEKKGVTFETIIHPSVLYSKLVEIGTGTIIQAGCILTVGIKIGNHVHININSTIGHESIIKDFVTINPGIEVNGNTTIDTGAYLGTGITMLQQIGSWSVIGAGTVLISDVPSYTMYAGVPGKLKKRLRKII